MSKIIEKVGPCRMKIRRNRFLTLVRSIVSQQISVAAARTILGRLEAAVSPDKIHPESLIPFDVEQLREFGVSRQKASYVLDLSHKVANKEVRLNRLGRLENDEVITELTQVKGIGVWTAQMFLMFSLGRLNVFPSGDLGIQNAIRKGYRLRKAPDGKRMEKIAAAWTPYETIACWYLWRSLEL